MKNFRAPLVAALVLAFGTTAGTGCEDRTTEKLPEVQELPPIEEKMNATREAAATALEETREAAEKQAPELVGQPSPQSSGENE